MEQPATCGQGIALHARLPAKMSQLLAAMADTLESHLRALDPEDPATAAERDAYRKLVDDHRQSAARLGQSATDMAGYRALPMPPHDVTKLGDESARSVFQSYVQAEEELHALLGRFLAEDRKMLTAMTAGGA